MKPMKRLLMQLLTSLLLLGATGNTFAQDVIFDCQTALPPPFLDISGTDQCKAANIDANVEELTKFATRVYDIIGTGSLPATLINSACIWDSITGGYNCALDSSPLPNQTPFNFNCSISYDMAYNGTATCLLGNAGYENVMKMECTQDSMNNSGICTFKLNRQPVLDTMQNASNFDEMNSNERFIHDAFWTCLNRVGISATNQIQCDKILQALMSDPAVATGIVDMLRAVTPNNSDISLDVSQFNNLHAQNNITGRLLQLRNGYASNSVNIRYFDGQQWLDRNTLLAANNVSMSDVSPEEPTRNMSEYGRLGLFLNGSAIKSSQDDSILEQAHDADTQIATLGMDYRITDTLVAGIAMNISQSQADYGGHAGNLDSNSTALIIYSSYYIGNWYLDANINYGQDNYDQERNIACNPTPVICPGGFYQSFASDFDGSQSMLSVATGYTWQVTAFGITPFIQLNHARIKTDAYTEDPSSTGLGSGEAYAMSISDQSRDTSTIRIGTNLQYTFATNNGVLIPLIGLYGIRELENNANTVTGHFIGNIATDGSFNLATNDVDTSYFIAACGLNFQLKNGNAGFINIQSTEGYENLDQIQLTAGWRWEL